MEMEIENGINWKVWLKQGDQYLKAGTPKGEKPKFGPEIRYNMLSMSLESYAMAILDYKQNLPDNHTFTDLVMGLERVMDLDADLKERILKYENIQSICSVEKFHIAAPTEDELKELRVAIVELGDIAKDVCPALN